MSILPFDSTEATLNNAGGKGLNLARLTRAGFPVPPGFILATEAYRTYVEANQLGPVIRSNVEGLSADDPSKLDQASDRIRTAFSKGEMPSHIAEALLAAYTQFGDVPVAVRSSATTEDLPDLSFAGQQDTFLNIIEEQGLMASIVDSWSSLWTARAIGYRTRNDIPHHDAALAVIVQEMVNSDVSGVLFTANPLTGRLSEMVVDATIGLGEALVSGRVEPDHYVLDSINGEIVEQMVGDKSTVARTREGGGVELTEGSPVEEACLSQEMIETLMALGRDVQGYYGAPQDIEWAFADDTLYVLQSRPITSLYPLPEVSFDPLIVWLSFGSVQGMVGPMTPLGRDIVQHIIAGAGELFLLDLDPYTTQVFDSAGERLWARITGLLRHPVGIKLVDPIFQSVEPSVGRIISQLVSEPGLGAGMGKLRLVTLGRLLNFALPIVARFIRNVLHPGPVRARLEARINTRLEGVRIDTGGDRFSRLSALTATMRSQFASAFPFVLPRFIPMIGPSMAALNILYKLAGEQRSLALEVMRALPGNVTTEMDLALWDTAVEIRRDPESVRVLRNTDAVELVERFRSGILPSGAQEAITQFMARYGMRGVGEIDFGQPRWREEPAPILYTLQSYLDMNADVTPKALFARGQSEALAAIESLVTIARAQSFGWFKTRIVRAASRRIRLLAGSRESPKFYIIRLMGIARQILLELGEEFANAGTIDQPDDLVYLTLIELDRLAQGEESDWMEIITVRRAGYMAELRRQQVPRVLVSDGRAFYEGLGAETDTDNAIQGSPVSPGVVEGIVHVVLDARGAQLEPGEILVCPGTDPAWTPLLMAASGLITEVGGLMTHGSVVAREFGIPAVVGVHQATERLRDGQRVRINGSTGDIEVMPEGKGL